MIDFKLHGNRKRSVRSTLAFTLVEVLWAAILVATGVAATVKAVNGAKRSGLSAQRTNEASKIAAGELDKFKTYSYKSLGMTGNVLGGTGGVNLPTGQCSRFLVGTAPSYTNCPTGSTVTSALQIKVSQHNGGTPVNEAIVEPQNGGIDETGDTAGAAGLVPNTPKSVSVGGNAEASNFRVYRYVTWHDEVCDRNGDNTLTTEDDCGSATTGHDTKTLTVAVESRDASGGAINPGEPGPNAVVWRSTTIADPSVGGPSRGCSGGPCGTTSNLLLQKFYLYDTPCNKTTRQPQTTSHATHLTTAQESTGWNATTKAVSSCKLGDLATQPAGNCRFSTIGVDDPWTSGTNEQTSNKSRCVPDLMGPTSPPVTAECDTCEVDPPVRYSANVWQTAPLAGAPSAPSPSNKWPQLWGYGTASSLLRRSANCPTSALPGTSENTTAISAEEIHTWATKDFAPSDFAVSGQNGFYVSGRMGLTFWVGSTQTGGGANKGKFCITLIDRDERGASDDPWTEDRIIYQFACSVNRVPQGRKYWAAANAYAVDENDRRAGAPLPGRRSCRFLPAYGQQNQLPGMPAAQVFPVPKTPASPGPQQRALCQDTNSEIIDTDGDNYDDNGYLVCNGHKLVVRVSVIDNTGTGLGVNGSNNDIALFYDHQVNPSNIEIATVAATSFPDDGN